MCCEALLRLCVLNRVFQNSGPTRRPVIHHHAKLDVNIKEIRKRSA